jgi:hypothetical protein
VSRVSGTHTMVTTGGPQTIRCAGCGYSLRVYLMQPVARRVQLRHLPASCRYVVFMSSSAPSVRRCSSRDSGPSLRHIGPSRVA